MLTIWLVWSSTYLFGVFYSVLWLYSEWLSALSIYITLSYFPSPIVCIKRLDLYNYRIALFLIAIVCVISKIDFQMVLHWFANTLFQHLLSCPFELFQSSTGVLSAQRVYQTLFKHSLTSHQSGYSVVFDCSLSFQIFETISKFRTKHFQIF